MQHGDTLRLELQPDLVYINCSDMHLVKAPSCATQRKPSSRAMTERPLTGLRLIRISLALPLVLSDGCSS